MTVLTILPCSISFVLCGQLFLATIFSVVASGIMMDSWHGMLFTLLSICARKHRWFKTTCCLCVIKPMPNTVYPKKYAHGFCFAVLCCGYTLTDFPISIRLASLALWQSNDCPSASKATLMNMDKYFMWIHYERLHNHNKAKHNKTVYFLGYTAMYMLHVLNFWDNETTLENRRELIRLIQFKVIIDKK